MPVSHPVRISASLAAFALLAAPAGALSWSASPVAPGLCTGAEPVPCGPAALFTERPGAFRAGFTLEPAAASPAPPKAGMPLWEKNVLLTAGFPVGFSVVTHLGFWSSHDRRPFHVTNEGFFASDTYTGGADKASHIVFSWIGQDAGEQAFRGLGNSPMASKILGAVASFATGLLVEVGDGYTYYGFSWQDLAADAVGSLASFGVSALGLRDTVGVRFGFVQPNLPPPEVPLDPPNNANDYSNQVFTLDLKLAGFLPRVGVPKPGAARFFLFSLRYDTQGYHIHPPEERQQNIGFEVSLNLVPIAEGLGLKRDRFWKKAILGILEYIRLPFTSIGYRYDLIHHEWHGPAAGINF